MSVSRVRIKTFFFFFFQSRQTTCLDWSSGTGHLRCDNTLSLVHYKHLASVVTSWDRGNHRYPRSANRMDESDSFWDLLSVNHWICARAGNTTRCSEAQPFARTAIYHSHITAMLCIWVKVEEYQKILHTGLSGDIIDEIPMGILAPKLPRGEKSTMNLETREQKYSSFTKNSVLYVP